MSLCFTAGYSLFLSDIEMSLGIAALLAAAIPSHAANSEMLVPAPNMLWLRNTKTSRFVGFGIGPEEMLQVGIFLHLLGKISLARSLPVEPS